ncbi:MAG: response regulator transcription factor [Chloroflexota bacterium]
MATSRAIRLLVAEPHEMVRTSLIALINVYDDITLVGEAQDGYEALSLCQELQPDVVLISLYLNKLDGILTTQRLCETPDHPYIVMLDGLLGQEHEKAAFDAGVNVYLTQESTTDDIVASIRASIQQP